MHRFWLPSGLLAATVALWLATPARPVPPRGAAPQTPLTEAVVIDAQRFAASLRQYVDDIQRAYFRPVTPFDLTRAALTGLYEAARQPVPAQFAETVERAYQTGRLDELMADTYAALAGHDAVRGEEKALYVALQAMPSVLDPYSGLLGQQAFRQLDFAYQTRSAGVIFAGMTLGNDRPRFSNSDPGTQSLPPGPLRVQQVIPGGPGQLAGLLPDDLIVAVNGKPSGDPGFAGETAGLMPIERNDRMPLPATVEVVRNGRRDPLMLHLHLKPFGPESVFGHRRRSDGSWDFLIDPVGKLAYVRLGPIWDLTHAEFCQVMERLASLGIRGMILDLRWCPGGVLAQSWSIARQLLPQDSVIVSQPGVGGRPFALSFETPDVRRYTDFDLVVLVNGETSGGGELIAAALQDHRRAAIAGRRTVGKASIQQVMPNIKYSFKVSFNVFIRPSGKNLQRFPHSRPEDDWGVRPDPGREITFTDEMDRRLKQAWTLHALRPATSREGTAADDPDFDPVRLAALRLLRERIAKPKA